LQTPLDALDIPTTVQGVSLARIDRLPETLKDVLQRAAVIGRVFTYPLLNHVVERGTELESVLEQLEHLEFIYPTSRAPQREYSFKHILAQEAVYQTLLRPRREVYHERVGKAMEALYPDHLEEVYDLLAYHYGRGNNPDKAVAYLDLVNQKAARFNAMEEAKQHFDEAMTFLDRMPETEENRRRRITLLVNQQTVMTLLLNYAEYYDQLTRYEPMAAELGDPRLLGMYYGRMGWGEWGFSRLGQAIQTLTQAAALCEDAGNTEDAAQAHLLLQWSHLMQGDFDQSLASHEQVLHLMQQQFHLRWYMWTVTGAARSHIYVGRWEAAVAAARKGIEVGEQFSDDSVISFSAWTLSLADTAQGDLERAFDDAKLALKKAPTPLDTVWSQSALAWAWSRSRDAPQRDRDSDPNRPHATRGALDIQ
jgi:tetratricopeptide (TPR) repeat protein